MSFFLVTILSRTFALMVSPLPLSISVLGSCSTSSPSAATAADYQAEEKLLLVDGHEILQEQGNAEGRKNKRYREVVQSCILHSCGSWSWNKEMVHAFSWMRKQELGSHELMKMVAAWPKPGMV